MPWDGDVRAYWVLDVSTGRLGTAWSKEKMMCPYDESRSDREK